MTDEPPRHYGDDDVHQFVTELEGLLERTRQRAEHSITGRGDLLLASAKRYTRCRSRRPSLFGNGDQADPAWDILIELYIADHEKRDVSISSATLAALVAPTTGLRWVSRLCDAGFTYREADDDDRRRVHLRLTDRGAHMVHQWLLSLSG